MHRFFIDEALSTQMRISGQDAVHLHRVLRLQLGNLITVVDVQGMAGIASITRIQDGEVLLDLKERLAEEREAPIHLQLAQGLPKSDKMDFIVQKAVELGVSSILPLETDQCVVRYEASKKRAKQERWQKIAAEAAKQSKRSVIPEVKSIQGIKELLANTSAEVCKVMLYEGQGTQGLKALLQEYKAEKYLLLVGPEGGFSDDEVALCRSHGVHIAGMGPRILRTETAGLTAISIVMYEYGDLGGSVCRV